MGTNVDTSYWAVSCLYMSSNSASRLNAFYQFRNMLRAAGVPLCIVELASSPEEYCLTSRDAELVIQLSGETRLWQKEALLNYAIEALPTSCTEVFLIDADIIFPDPDWVQQVRDALKNSHAVQLFSRLVYLPRNVVTVTDENLSQYLDTEKFSVSTSYLYSQYPFASGVHALPGGAWGYQRSFIQNIRLFDQAICGGGDTIVTRALLNLDVPGYYEEPFPKAISEQARLWAEQLRTQTVNWTYCDLTAAHLYHGSLMSRNYGSRYKRRFWREYDPDRALSRDQHGLHTFQNPAGVFAQEVRKYFDRRNESGQLKLLGFRSMQFLANIFDTDFLKYREKVTAQVLYSLLWSLDKNVFSGGQWHITCTGAHELSGLNQLQEDLLKAGGTFLEEAPDRYSKGRSFCCFRGRGKQLLSLLESDHVADQIPDILLAEVSLVDAYIIISKLMQMGWQPVEHKVKKLGVSFIGAIQPACKAK